MEGFYFVSQYFLPSSHPSTRSWEKHRTKPVEKHWQGRTAHLLHLLFNLMMIPDGALHIACLYIHLFYSLISNIGGVDVTWSTTTPEKELKKELKMIVWYWLAKGEPPNLSILDQNKPHSGWHNMAQHSSYAAFSKKITGFDKVIQENWKLILSFKKNFFLKTKTDIFQCC